MICINATEKHHHLWLVSPKGEAECSCGKTRKYPQDWEAVVSGRHLRRDRSPYTASIKWNWKEAK